MILIKNGLIIENNQLVKKDILIENNKITKIANKIEGDYQLIDADNHLVMPGLVDVHVHLREPGYIEKETVKSGTLAAAAGGVTTIMPMPNLNPCPDSVENLELEKSILKKDSIVHAYPYASVSINEEDKELSDIENLHDKVLAFTDDGKGVNNIELLEKAMKLAKKYDFVIASHAEDNAYKLDPKGEYVAVRREIELAKKIGCRYHFCHMSTKESFDEIRKARSEGYTNITCEVAPHHLILNEEMIKDANWKMNPPLRSEENSQETIKALLDGTAQIVASDHAPHTEKEKEQEYSKCPNGIIGLETMFPIIYTYFVKTGLIDLNKLCEIMVYNAIKIFNLPKYGIYEGSDANIAIFEINKEREYKKEDIISKGKNSPYIGMKFYGFAMMTMVDGKVVYMRKD